MNTDLSRYLEKLKNSSLPISQICSVYKPHASGVTAKVNAITDISTCKTMSKEDAVTAGLYEVIEKEVDLVLATDPDAGRLGVYVKDTKSGEYIPLTGNISGSLL